MVKKSSPQGSDWGSHSGTLDSENAGKKIPKIFSPPHSTDCLEHPGMHPAEPWLPLTAQKSLLQKHRHCWIFSDLIWMKYLIRSCCSSWQNTHRQQSPIFTRSASGINLLFSKWRQHQMAEQSGAGGKSPSPAVKTALLIFVKRYETRTKETFCWLFPSSLVLSTASSSSHHSNPRCH